MRFFKPNDRFWEWLTTLDCTLPVVDCGCGDGALVRELRQHGRNACGIDPRYTLFDEEVPMDLCDAIIPLEAREVQAMLSAKVAVLICRPCHSGFPADVVTNQGPDTMVYYVGFEKNLTRDLTRRQAAMARLLLTEVGEDGESIYHMP